MMMNLNLAQISFPSGAVSGVLSLTCCEERRLIGVRPGGRGIVLWVTTSLYGCLSVHLFTSFSRYSRGAFLLGILYFFPILSSTSESLPEGLTKHPKTDDKRIRMMTLRCSQPGWMM